MFTNDFLRANRGPTFSGSDMSSTSSAGGASADEGSQFQGAEDQQTMQYNEAAEKEKVQASAEKTMITDVVT